MQIVDAAFFISHNNMLNEKKNLFYDNIQVNARVYQFIQLIKICMENTVFYILSDNELSICM